MWVYKQDSLRNRLRLRAAVGNWLDYWLFLHAEETHPVWCNRPLGLRQLAAAALQSNAKYDYTLRKALADEALRATKLLPFLSGVPPVPTGDLAAASGWEAAWLDWFQAVSATALESLVHELATATSRALAAQDYSTAFFLTRRLAAEVTEDDWSHTGRFIEIKRALCDSGSFADREPDLAEFTDVLTSAFSPGSTSRFTVTVPVASTKVTRTVARIFHRGPRLLLESKAEGPDVLTGIEIDTDARRADEAAAFALEVARKVLDDLRLLFYVRTHLSGSVLVNKAESEESVYLSLPQPFWSKAPGRREVPRLPRKFNEVLSMLPEEESARWNAARWHLSQAFADWAEDSHTAAAHLWQALEAYSLPGGWRNVFDLIPTYLEQAVPAMGEHLATRVSLQARELNSIGQPCDWYYWVAKNVPFRTWLGRVLNAGSFNCYDRWSSPPAPMVLFHKDLGLLQVVNRRLWNSAEPWMEKRLEADLTLLYGLRNKAVHGGQPVLPRRMARYLGQTAAEVLFGVMASRAESIRSASVAPTGCEPS